MSMNRYDSDWSRDNCPCHDRRRRDGLLGDRYDKFDRYDRFDMKDRHGLRGDRFDDMHGRRGMEYRRDRGKRGCCW